MLRSTGRPSRARRKGRVRSGMQAGLPTQPGSPTRSRPGYQGPQYGGWTPQAGMPARPAPPTPAVAPPRPPAPTIAAPVAAPAAAPGPAPESSTGSDIRAGAQANLTAAEVANRDAIFRAAMSLGDPNIIAQLQKDPNFAGFKFASDPNSVFNTLARQEKEGLQGVDQASNQNNAFFSGFRLQDRTKLSDEVSRDRLGATTDYNNQLTDFAKALLAAQDEFRAKGREATRADTEAASAAEPEDRSTPAAGGGKKGKTKNANKAKKASQTQKAKASAAAAEAEAKAKKKAKKKGKK